MEDPFESKAPSRRATLANWRQWSVDGFAEGEFRFDPGNAGEVAEDVGVQALEVGQVARDDVDEIVARAGHEMTGEHVRACRKRRLEGAERVVVLPLERDLDKDVDAEPDRLG